MNDQEIAAIVEIALMAAMADGLKDEREREGVRGVIAALDADGAIDFPALLRRVLVEQPDLEQATQALSTPQAKQLAYEMAVGICDADGTQNPAERDFLTRLAATLGLPGPAAQEVGVQADEIAAAAAAPVERDTAVAGTGPDAAAMDDMILKASITNAALELLPETLASLAIIPLQMRLVYRIGLAHGYELDRGHLKDFLATAGVGLTGQYLEQTARKLLGGLLGSLGGGLGRYAGRQAASSGLAFATTYALGRLAQRYYAGGRTLDATTLKATFASLVDEARRIAPQYRDQIEARSQTIDRRALAQLVRSG